MRTMKVPLIPIVIFLSIFSFYAENGYGRWVVMGGGSDFPKGTLTIIDGTENIVNLLSRLKVIDNDKITIPYRTRTDSISGSTYQIENAEECLRKIKDLVALNTSYSSLEVKGPEDEEDDQNLQFILEWKYWGKTESVVCHLKSVKEAEAEE